MSRVCDVVDNSNISPVPSKSKHTCTPMRTRRKTSRRDQGLDVHTVTTSTPTAYRSPRLQRPRQQGSPHISSADHSSPSSSFPCSQDNRPDVVWDFTSPKLPKGSKKKDLKITVKELLDNLNQCQGEECSSKSTTYMKLLENWMSKQPAKVTNDQKKNHKKTTKKNSKYRVEELRKFVESIQRPTNENKSLPKLKSQKGKKAEEQNTSFKNSFLEAGSTDDSSEELWGDMDNSFIVQATQELDKVAFLPTTTSNIEMVSTIPETAPNPSTSKVTVVEVPKKQCEQHSDLLLHLSNIDWDADGDDDWDNGFLLEEDDLSLVSDNALSGVCAAIKEEKENVFENGVTGLGAKNVIKDILTEDVLCLGETEISVKPNSLVSAELYNSFDDGSFEEESLLCQPDILSKLDEVESMLSQPKCTPEEIKKKKEAALKRRTRNQLKRKT